MTRGYASPLKCSEKLMCNDAYLQGYTIKYIYWAPVVLLYMTYTWITALLIMQGFTSSVFESSSKF